MEWLMPLASRRLSKQKVVEIPEVSERKRGPLGKAAQGEPFRSAHRA